VPSKISTASPWQCRSSIPQSAGIRNPLDSPEGRKDGKIGSDPPVRHDGITSPKGFHAVWLRDVELFTTFLQHRGQNGEHGACPYALVIFGFCFTAGLLGQYPMRHRLVKVSRSTWVRRVLAQIRLKINGFHKIVLDIVRSGCIISSAMFLNFSILS